MPLITQFYGAFQDAYQIFLVMEYCAGGDLLERLKKENRAMSERRVILEVAVPLLRTLQHMHGHSIIHRWRSCPPFDALKDGSHHSIQAWHRCALRACTSHLFLRGWR